MNAKLKNDVTYLYATDGSRIQIMTEGTVTVSLSKEEAEDLLGFLRALDAEGRLDSHDNPAWDLKESERR